MDDEALREMAKRLVQVDGIVGVVLGGSRARGEHRPDSDFDLGLYYERPLDTEALDRLARKLAGDGAEVTAPGAWGPWVDGGGWLSVDGHAVDWLYRELSRVEVSVGQAQAGRFTFHAQVGHPLGVPDFAYAWRDRVGSRARRSERSPRTPSSCGLHLPAAAAGCSGGDAGRSSVLDARRFEYGGTQRLDVCGGIRRGGFIAVLAVAGRGRGRCR